MPKEFQSICTCIFVTTNKRTDLDSSDIKVEVFELYYKLRWLRFWRFSMIFAFTAICNKLFKLKLPQEFQSICTCIFVTTNKRSELDSSDIKVEVFELYYKLRWLRFWRFSMIFAFTAICNKLFKLKLPKEFQSICTCIFVTTNKRTDLDSSDIKVEVFELYYKLRWLRFWRFSMIFAFTAICNKLFKLKLPQEFQSICTCIFVTTNNRTELDSSNIKVKVFELYYKLRWLRFWRFSKIFASTAIWNKLFKIKLPQEFQSICTCIFVTTNNRTELDSSDIKVEVFELYYKLRWLRFWRFSMIFAFTAICNKLFKLKLPKEFQSICTCIFVTTNKRTELDSSDIKVEVFELYYKLRWLRFWRFSIIFAFTAICNKLFKLKLPQVSQSICTCIFVTTNK